MEVSEEVEVVEMVVEVEVLVGEEVVILSLVVGVEDEEDLAVEEEGVVVMAAEVE